MMRMRSESESASSMRLSLRNPTWVIIGLIQPVLYLSLFGPLLRRLPLAGPGTNTSNNWRIFVPGLLVQLGIFGAAFVGFGLIAEYRAGVIERMRDSPASRTALLLGRVLRDVVVLVMQATILVAAAVPFGLRVPLGDAVIGLLIVALLGASFSSLSYAAALTLKSEDALAPLLNGLAVPLLLLSGILLPMSLAPRWLRVLADINPLKHVVDAMRALFVPNGATRTVLWGVGVTAALVAVGVLLGARTFKHDSTSRAGSHRAGPGAGYWSSRTVWHRCLITVAASGPGSTASSTTGGRFGAGRTRTRNSWSSTGAAASTSRRHTMSGPRRRIPRSRRAEKTLTVDSHTARYAGDGQPAWPRR
jgi:ABC-2 type transport system permease protein